MEHVNDWCFRDIYNGGLWEDDFRFLCPKESIASFGVSLMKNANGTLFR